MKDLIKCTALVLAPAIGGLIMWGLNSLHLVRDFGGWFLIALSLWGIKKVWDA